MDRISRLPDEVITHILSFLPLEKSAQTSVLSKRWRNVFAFSRDLEMLHYGDEIRRPSFLRFVDRVLAVSGNYYIEKFSLSCRKGSRTKRWIRDVLNRGGLLDLDLRLFIGDYPVDLPCEIFTCKTLVKLKLTGFWIVELPEDASLPALKKLFLKSVKFDGSLHQVCAFEKLLSACPVLEKLVLDDSKWEQWKWSRSLSSRSLRKLTIGRTDFRAYAMSDFGNITIDTPSVTHLDYADLVPSSYQVLNLNSLVEANLHLAVTVDRTWGSSVAEEGENITSNPTNLFKGMRNVQILNLLSQDTLEIFYFFRGGIPVFENLLHLSITTVSYNCWRGLVFLLKSCPNLETLTINVVKITEYRGSIGELVQLKNILEKLSCLELLEVRILRDYPFDMEFEKAEDVEMLPRASSKCKIEIY